MSEDAGEPKGPDFAAGVDIALLRKDPILRGHVGGEPAILIKAGEEIFAVGASCTHYGAPLADGLVVGETVRCPWHHAAFSLRTGEAVRAPAPDPVAHWRVETEGSTVFARERSQRPRRPRIADSNAPESAVIVGGGVAGNMAAETLRREGYAGPVTIFSADATLPCDRPNLSKGYLAGSADDESNLLRSEDFYREQEIDVRLNARVARIDVQKREIELADGSRAGFGALILATGADPVRLPVAGSDLPHVHYLRTLADSRAIVAAAQSATRALIIGASFIGLEVASSLRARGLAVDVVGREAIPMEQILGADVGAFLRAMHEDHGVTFHLGRTVSAIENSSVRLDSGETIAADLVVIGIGVRPALALAEEAGLDVDHGVLVNEYLETSAPGIFAVGDIAAWPDPLTGERIRVEHFVVAERQAQTAARNLLGRREAFDAVPFFWTEQYDFGLAYVGHAGRWDSAEIDGDLGARDCSITYRSGGRKLAVAFIHRDLDGLRAEVEFERRIATEPAPANLQPMPA